jgi:CheY-like chemotaxis protein
VGQAATAAALPPARERSGWGDAESRKAAIAAERAAESLTRRHRERSADAGGRTRRKASGPASRAADAVEARDAVGAGDAVEAVPAARTESAITTTQAGGEAKRRRKYRDFRGRKVLIVDDDVRNVFALTSVLEQHGLKVLYAENGREGIEVLESNEDIVLVLMDIMMPEMDGYATTAAIRRMPQFSGLPIIALTAKAMKGDQEKSIESGASDHVTKPVDTDQLLSVMSQWLDGK